MRRTRQAAGIARVRRIGQDVNKHILVDLGKSPLRNSTCFWGRFLGTLFGNRHFLGRFLDFFGNRYFGGRYF